MINFNLVFNSLLNIAAVNPEGYTVDKNTLQPITAGYSVAVEATQNSFGPEGAAKVLYYAYKHKEVKALGGWYNSKNNKFYFDAVIICDTLEEAVKLGRLNKQLAIFDLNTMTEIEL